MQNPSHALLQSEQVKQPEKKLKISAEKINTAIIPANDNVLDIFQLASSPLSTHRPKRAAPRRRPPPPPSLADTKAEDEERSWFNQTPSTKESIHDLMSQLK